MNVVKLWHASHLKQLHSRQILNRNVMITECWHSLGFTTTSIATPRFPNAKRLLIDRCDVNFTYYWLSPELFPCLSAIYVRGGIDKQLRHRFHKTLVFYAPKQIHTFPDPDIIYLDDKTIDKIFDTCKEEDMYLD